MDIKLRDYFAGQCLAGMLVNPEFVKLVVRERKQLIKDGLSVEKHCEANQLWHAETCYQFADAMMKEREKDTPM